MLSNIKSPSSSSPSPTPDRFEEGGETNTIDTTKSEDRSRGTRSEAPTSVFDIGQSSPSIYFTTKEKTYGTSHDCNNEQMKAVINAIQKVIEKYPTEQQQEIKTTLLKIATTVCFNKTPNCLNQLEADVLNALTLNGTNTLFDRQHAYGFINGLLTYAPHRNSLTKMFYRDSKFTQSILNILNELGVKNAKLNKKNILVTGAVCPPAA